jgi:hypothetical protein
VGLQQQPPAAIQHGCSVSACIVSSSNQRLNIDDKQGQGGSCSSIGLAQRRSAWPNQVGHNFSSLHIVHQRLAERLAERADVQHRCQCLRDVLCGSHTGLQPLLFLREACFSTTGSTSSSSCSDVSQRSDINEWQRHNRCRKSSFCKVVDCSVDLSALGKPYCLKRRKYTELCLVDRCAACLGHNYCCMVWLQQICCQRESEASQALAYFTLIWLGSTRHAFMQCWRSRLTMTMKMPSVRSFLGASCSVATPYRLLLSCRCLPRAPQVSCCAVQGLWRSALEVLPAGAALGVCSVCVCCCTGDN